MSGERSQQAIFTEEIQSDLSRMSELHTQLVIFDNFKTGLEEADRAK